MKRLPAVAVVMATYNRSAVLRHAIASVVGQRFTDWELLVVGDACTDDTADVVASFEDERIRFVNLPINVGEQSGPNNVGVARTEAPLVAFLNHDDLWFPDHLERLVAVLQARQADLVFSPNFNIVPSDGSQRPGPVLLDGLPSRGRFDPGRIDRAVPASGWLVTRAALERVRGWRSGDECVIEPSQDLLFRAHRAGMRLFCAGPPTVICIASGTRRNSYVAGGDSEHSWYAERLASDSLRSDLYAAAAWSEANGYEPERSRLLSAWYGGLRGLSHFGISPRAVDYAVLRRHGRGELIRRLRRHRGLQATPMLAAAPTSWRDTEVAAACAVDVPATIDFSADGDGARCCSHGWSRPESWGVWSSASRAAVVVRPLADGAVTLRLTMTAHVDAARPRQRVVVDVGGSSRMELLSGPGPHVIEAVLVGGVTNWLTLSFPDRWSPASADTRQLAIGLISADLDISGV